MTANLDEQVKDILRNVPLGMSVFQVEQLIVPKGSPTRSYRQAALELKNEYEALKKAEFRRRRLEAEQRLLQKKIAAEKDEDQRTIHEVDLEEKLFDASMEDVLIEDCMERIIALLSAIENLPKVTREAFNAGELAHWQQRFFRQARNQYLATGRISEGLLEEAEKIGIAPEQLVIDIRHTADHNLKIMEEQRRRLLAEQSAREGAPGKQE